MEFSHIVQEKPFYFLYGDSCMGQNKIYNLKPESTIVITILNPNDSRISITKFTLIVFYIVFGIANEFSFLSSNFQIDFVL